MVFRANSTGDDAHASTTVTYDGKEYNVVREGGAEILDLVRPGDSKHGASKPQTVFYNPIQQYNRDLSVLAIKAFSEDYAVIRNARYLAKKSKNTKGKQRGKKGKNEQPKDSANVEKTNGVETSTGIPSEPAVEISEESVKRKRIDDGESQGPESKRVDTGKTVALDGPESDGISGEATGPQPPRDETSVTEHAASTVTKGQDIEVHATDPDLADGQSSHHERQETPHRQQISKNTTDVNKPTAASTQPAFRIFDALSATGIRALRYAKEIPMATMIVANDVLPSATDAIRLNAKHNALSEKIVPNTSDAIHHMQHEASISKGGFGHYQVIDLDPYGTAAPFLDAAVRALVDGGLLCVTCTDAGVFASVGYLEKTFSQYGGLPIKGPHAHEGGLRLILHAIATTAARYGLAIEPLLSLSIDFYARVFVRISRSPAEVKFLASKTMTVYGCDTGCGAWSIQHLAKAKEKVAKNGDTIYNFTSALAPCVNTTCEHCGFKTHQAGPMWGGPLHNPHFIQRILDMLPSLDRKTYGTIPRIEGMLTLALNEGLDDEPDSKAAGMPVSASRPIPPLNPVLRANHPFFFLPSSLARVLHCNCPSEAQFRGALLSLSYRTTRSHTKGGSISTNAPWSVIWEIMREWIRQKSPIKKEAIKERTAGWGIMQKDRTNKLGQARQAVKEAIDKKDIKDLEGLKTEIEAVLYRLSSIKNVLGQAQVDGAKGEVLFESKADGKNNSEDPYTADIALPGHNEHDSEKVKRPDRPRSPVLSDLKDFKVVFDEALGREPQGKRMVRYQVNPRPDWGPMNRAKGDT